MAWDLFKFTIFDQTFDIDLGTIAFDYEVPWERFYVGTAGMTQAISAAAC